MITTEKLKTVTPRSSFYHHDWSFLPVGLTAFAGVGIGVAIGFYLGWL